jgi:hypothetical protein
MEGALPIVQWVAGQDSTPDAYQELDNQSERGGVELTQMERNPSWVARSETTPPTGSSATHKHFAIAELVVANTADTPARRDRHHPNVRHPQRMALHLDPTD